MTPQKKRIEKVDRQRDNRHTGLPLFSLKSHDS